MNYPEEPGYTDEHASKMAAEKIKPGVRGLRQRVLDFFWESRDQGPDTKGYYTSWSPPEVAYNIHTNVYGVGPRFTELAHAGLIQKVGTCRFQGRVCNTWELTPYALTNQIRTAPRPIKRPAKSRLTKWVVVWGDNFITVIESESSMNHFVEVIRGKGYRAHAAYKQTFEFFEGEGV